MHLGLRAIMMHAQEALAAVGRLSDSCERFVHFAGKHGGLP